MGADAQNRYRISLAPPPPLEIRSAPPLRKPALVPLAAGGAAAEAATEAAAEHAGPGEGQ